MMMILDGIVIVKFVYASAFVNTMLIARLSELESKQYRILRPHVPDNSGRGAVRVCLYVCIPMSKTLHFDVVLTSCLPTDRGRGGAGVCQGWG
jgi:hypothetical protein